MKQKTIFLEKYFPIILLLTLSIGIYSNTFKHEFALDDVAVISNNELVKKGIGGITEIFTSRAWKGFEQNRKQVESYRPLSSAHFAIEYEFFQLNSGSYHIVQVLYFALLCVLIYWLLLEFFDRKYPYLALIIALLFAAHPIHSDVVNNIKSRDELFALLNGVISCLLFFKYLRKQQIYLFALAVFFYFLSLLSKENAVTFLAVFPLAMFFFRAIPIKKIAIYTLPFLGVAIVFFGLRYQMLAGVPDRVFSFYDNPLLLAETTSQWFGMRFYGIGKNLQLLIFPHPLTSSYFYNDIPVFEIYAWQSWLSVLFYLAIAGVALKFFKTKKVLVFGIMYYAATFSVFTNLIIQASDFLGERWLFMPSLGFCIALGATLYALAKNKEFTNPSDFFTKNPILSLVLLIILGLYSFKTYDRNQAWKNSYTLASTDIKTSPESQLLNSLLPTEMIKKFPEDKEKLKEALKYFEKGVKLRPSVSVWNNIGTTYHRLGDFESAIKAYQKAVKKDPRHTGASLGIVDSYIRLQKYKKALAYCLKLKQSEYFSQNSKLYLQTGVALGNLGRVKEAAQYFEKGLELLKDKTNKAELLDIYGNISNAYYFDKNYERAIFYLKKTLALNPKNATFTNYLGISYLNLGKYQLAIKHFENVLKLNKNLTDVYKNIAFCYQELGNNEQKEKYFKIYQEFVAKR